MGLIIKQKNDKKIVLYGTSIELPEVYGRVVSSLFDNGVTMESVITLYSSKLSFTEGAPLHTNLGSLIVVPRYDVDLNVEEQSISASLKYAKLFVEQLGYEVEIEIDN